MADYNIAMGIKQPEPVNYLGQMAQVMGIKAAQDEIQGNEAVKQFYAQGGDLSSPEARARLKSINPKFGMAAEKAQSDLAHTQATTQKARNDSLKEAIALSVAGLANIGDVDSYRAWSLAHHDPKLNPELSAYFNRIGSTPDKAQARIDEMVAKYGPAEGLQRLKNESMGAVPELFKHLNQSADNKATNAQSNINNQRTVGAAMYGHNVSRQNTQDRLAFEKAKGHVIAGEGEFINFDPYGNARRVSGYETQFGPNAPVDARSAAILGANAAAPVAGAPVNAMLTGGGGAAPMLNNLNPAAQAAGAGPTVAAAAQLAAPQARPMPPARAGYQRDAQGREVKIPQVGVPEGVRLGVDERWNDVTKQVELVPGSKTYLATQNKQAADREAARKVAEATSWGAERVQRLLSPENKNGLENQFGGYTAYITRLFSGDTATVGAELSSLKSDMKNAGLQVIRAGGSIGAMTEKEWPIVEGLIDSLDPKMPVKDAVTVFKRIEAKLGNIAQTAAQTYDDKWGGTQFHKPLQTASGGGGANTVVTPDGMTHSFPNAAAAAAFKKAAGL